jgi:hypothetical protein
MDVRALFRRVQQVVTRGRVTRTEARGPWCQVGAPGRAQFQRVKVPNGLR